MKTRNPLRYSRLAPRICASRPAGSKRLVMAMTYANVTHCTRSKGASNSRTSVGSETLTMLASSVAMKTPLATTAIVPQRALRTAEGPGRLLSEGKAKLRQGCGQAFHVAAAQVIADSDEVYVVSRKAQVIRTSISEIRNTGRATQGVTIFKPEPGDSVASMACVGDFEVPEEVKMPSFSQTNGKGNGKVPPKALD